MKYTAREMYCTNGENRIYGVLYLPEKSGKLPAVILSHGYNSSHDYMNDLAEKLAESGIAAYCYDFCGGSSVSISDGKTTDMGIDTEISDLKAVIDTVKKSDFCDPEKLFLYGESQGGFVSGLTAAELKNEIAGLAMLYPAFCIADDWGGKVIDENTPDTFEFMGMTISKRFADSIPKYDIYEKMSEYENPTAFFHGTADPVVNISYSEKLVQCMKSAELTVYENEGHGFSPSARAEMTDKAVNFFCRLSERN